MTFQLGFAIEDGVIMASDEKYTSLVGFKHSAIAPKIHTNPSLDFAHCSAGDTDSARVFTDEVKLCRSSFGSARSVEIVEILKGCAESAKRKDEEIRQKHRLPGFIGFQTFMVFKQDAVCSLFSLENTPFGIECSLVPSGTYRKHGSENSPAVFFTEWYTSKVPNTVAGRISLALHTVKMGKGDYVEGVEIGVFTQNLFRVLTEAELAPFIELSNRIDSSILQEFCKTCRLQ
jgi:hypothetical protein